MNGESGGNVVTSGDRRRVDVPLVALLTHPQRDPDRGDDRGDRAEHEDERDPTELRGPERADRRAEQQAAHLRRPVQPERLAAPVRWRRVGQEAARGRVVDGRTETGTRAQQHERHRPGEDERQRPEHAGRDEPDDHQRHPLGAVRQPAEDRLADEACRRPRGDDDAERREVDALLDEVERQDGQQAAEPQPDDELRDEERRDATPSFEPGRPIGGAGATRRRDRAGSRRRAGEGSATWDRGCGSAGQRSPRGRPDGPDAPGRTGGRLTRNAYTRDSDRPNTGVRHRMDAITAEGLVKIYKTRKSEVRALDGVDLNVPEGTVLGLLGPNGAGKTTAVRILATLLKPDSGRATIAGFDLARQPDDIRRVIGLSGQYAAVDENLTGSENLWLFGRLYQLSSAEATRRAKELLEQFDLVDAADRVVKTYSGGMRRRLDLGSALIGRPRLLFLDEPTTGLDPRSRIGMWDVIRGLVREGVTLLLTTQYLEEADELADRIVVIDHGKIIARGTADELKSEVGGERIEVVIHERDAIPQAREILSRDCAGDVTIDEHTRRLTAPTSAGAGALVQVVRDLDEAGIHIDDIALRRPTLDDVFLSLTGHAAEEETLPAEAGTRSAA